MRIAERLSLSMKSDMAQNLWILERIRKISANPLYYKALPGLADIAILRDLLLYEREVEAFLCTYASRL